jgi:hypothetical protein
MRIAPTESRQLIDAASFGPEALKAIGEAFDTAWAEVAGNFGNDPTYVEKARLRLAKALLTAQQCVLSFRLETWRYGARRR